MDLRKGNSLPERRLSEKLQKVHVVQCRDQIQAFGSSAGRKTAHQSLTVLMLEQNISNIIREMIDKQKLKKQICNVCEKKK